MNCVSAGLSWMWGKERKSNYLSVTLNERSVLMGSWWKINTLLFRSAKR